jgi:hypothetical protein
MRAGRIKNLMLNVAKGVLSAAMAAALIVLAARADAAVVSGVYTSRGGAPLGDHQLHFENRISGDMYLTRTGSDGSFSADLPPGTYDLRAERGLIVKSKIVVGASELNVGHITDGAPLDVRRPFERQGIGPALVDSDAPATAHLDKAATAPASTSASPQAAASQPTSASQMH